MAENLAHCRIPALDGLRALAIVLVFLRHMAHSFSHLSGATTAGAGWNFFFNGWIGVDLFFVLSGYLITKSLASSPAHDWKIYAQKRFLRIFPAYAAVLAACLLGVFPYYAFSGENLGYRVFYHLLFLQDYLPSDINVVFWSLGVEEKFYILAPFIVFFSFRGGAQKALRRLLAVAACVFALGYGLRLGAYLYAQPETYTQFFNAVRSPFHANLEPLLLGMLIAFAQFHGGGALFRLVRHRYFFAAVFLTLIFLGAGTNMMQTIDLFDVLVQPLVISLLMGGLVLSVVAGFRHVALENRVTAFLSRISYSFYLVHFPLAPVSYILYAQVGGGNAVLYALIYFAISLGTASVFHALFERPFLRMKDRLSTRPVAVM